MAYADVVDSRLVRIWINTTTKAGGTKLCAMTTKNFNQTKETNDQPVPYCTDPTQPAVIRRTVVSRDVEITGSGLYTHQERAVLQALYDLNIPKGVVFELPRSQDGTPGGYYSGNYHLTEFNIVANEADFVEAELTWMIDGASRYTVG